MKKVQSGILEVALDNGLEVNLGQVHTLFDSVQLRLLHNLPNALEHGPRRILSLHPHQLLFFEPKSPPIVSYGIFKYWKTIIDK